jgi:hypothetical protein
MNCFKSLIFRLLKITFISCLFAVIVCAQERQKLVLNNELELFSNYDANDYLGSILANETISYRMGQKRGDKQAILLEVWVNSVSLEPDSSDESTTGIWEKRFFVDEFGDETSSTYITPKELLVGFFSNSATKNSKLKVSIIVSGNDEIAFQLYEYGGSNPVKASSTKHYKIKIKDSQGIIHSLPGIMYEGSQRIYVDTENTISRMHAILLDEGKIAVRIQEEEDYGYPSTYSFSIPSNGYRKSFRLLSKKN